MAQQLTAQQIQQAKMARDQKNAKFMKYSQLTPVLFNAPNGNNFQAGQTLIFENPATYGYLSKITIRANLTVNVALGAGTATLSQAAPHNIFDFNLNYGSRQISLNGYVAKVLNDQRGYMKNRPDNLFGNQSTAIQNMLVKPPTVNNGNNNWVWDNDIDLNGMIHPNSVAGLLPISSTSTKAQLQVVCAPGGLVGNDPLLNCISVTGGATATVTGTVQVIGWFRSYQSVSFRDALDCDLTGVPAVQVIRLGDVPIQSGSMIWKNIQNPYPIAKIISVAIDGSSASTFADVTKLQAIELDRDENPNNAAYRYDSSTGGVLNFFRQRVRDVYGSDFSDGVLPIFDATVHNVVNPSNLNGESYLNLTSAGYPAARYGVQFSATGAVTNARLATWAVILNPAGLNIQA